MAPRKKRKNAKPRRARPAVTLPKPKPVRPAPQHAPLWQVESAKALDSGSLDCQAGGPTAQRAAVSINGAAEVGLFPRGGATFGRTFDNPAGSPVQVRYRVLATEGVTITMKTTRAGTLTSKTGRQTHPITAYDVTIS